MKLRINLVNFAVINKLLYDEKKITLWFVAHVSG